MTLAVLRRIPLNATMKAAISTAGTTVVGPIPSNVETIRVFSTIATLIGLGVDNQVAITTSGATVGHPVPAAQYVDIPVPANTRFLGIRPEAGSGSVYVTPLGAPFV